MKVKDVIVPDLHMTGDKEFPPYNSVEGTLRPLLVSMKIFGLYFDPKPSRNKEEHTDSPTNQSKPGLRFCTIHRVYSYLILLLLWFDLGRTAVGLFPLNEGLPLRIIWTSWVFMCTLNATVMITACQKLSLMRSFYNYWNSRIQCPVTHSLGCGFKYPLKNVTLGTAFGWVVIVLNVSSMGAILFTTPPSQMYKTNFVRPFSDSNVSISFTVILLVFQSAAWILPVIFINIISRVIGAQFLQVRNTLSKQILKANNRIPDCFPQLRSHFTHLCQTVEIINVPFKWILGTCFLLNTFMTWFLSYRIIHTRLEFSDIAISAFCLVECFVNTFLLAIRTSDVHNTAHSLLNDILNTGTKDANVEQFGQLYLFVSKLTGTSIGFTVLDFFVISKEFLLTLGGLYHLLVCPAAV